VFLVCIPRIRSHARRAARAARIERLAAETWVSGGPYGVGNRMKLSYTRSMVHCCSGGKLDEAEFRTDLVFGLSVPTAIPERAG